MEKSDAGVLPGCHQADIKIRCHHLPRLDDDKFAESYQCRLDAS